MREIEFRAWLKDYLKMVPVIDLDFDFKQIGVDDFTSSEYKRYFFVGFDKIELMEYIGLKDKNGVKIFEGDIVRCDDEICTIVWDEQYLTYAVNFKEDGNTNLGDFESKDLEVIGNIYENKELLGR